MGLLSISLLGTFCVTMDSAPITQFESDAVRALLAYLAMHPGITCRREALAGLLWPDRPDSVALHNLRQALSNLRKTIRDREPDREASASPPFLHVTRKTIQFNAKGNYWLDVNAFTDAVDVSQEHQHRRV